MNIAEIFSSLTTFIILISIFVALLVILSRQQMNDKSSKSKK